MECYKCGATENLHLKQVNKSGPVYRCRECNTQSKRAYRKTKAGKAAVSRAVRKYDKAHPERRQAWAKCQKLGTKPCEVCGETKTDKHHPDITKPMEVIWLCRVHHKEAHKKLLAIV